MKNKNIEKFIKGSEESYIIATKNGTGVVGTQPEVLTHFTMLVRNLRKNISDEDLKQAFEMSFKNIEELISEAKEIQETLLKKIAEKLGVKNNE